jgi:deazaflavin-dependent oxidoreductase (nitroreductase family)
MHDFNKAVIEEFRANAGRVGGPFEGSRLILLTTTGARTGKAHVNPLGYLPDGDRVLVIASAGGSPRDPDWFRNLVAEPRVTVEDGVFTYPAVAVVLPPGERDAAFARAVEADPGWGEYQARTARTIPVVALEPAPTGPPQINAASHGAGLKAVHDAFRRELATIRRELDGPVLHAQLRVNCLTVCAGLGHHHRMEDGGMFAYLREQRPDLHPVLDRLEDEHERVAKLLAQLREALDGADRDTVRRDVERLTRELEAHLTYEEEQLIPVLDAS